MFRKKFFNLFLIFNLILTLVPFNFAKTVWTDLESIEQITDTVNSWTDPLVEMDSQGNVIVVWWAGSNLFAKRYDVVDGWDQSITTLDTGSRYPRLAIDGSGNAIAIWMKDSDTSIYAKYFNVSNKQWDSSATLLEQGDGSVAIHDLAMSPSGKAIATWYQTRTGAEGIYYNTFNINSSSSWMADAIQVTGITYLGATELGIDNSGNAQMVWEAFFENPSYAYRIYAKSFDGSDTLTWSAESEIGNQLYGSTDVKVAVEPDGDAVAVWEQNGNIYSNTLTSGNTVWNGIITIADNGDYLNSPIIEMNSVGDAISIWNNSSSNYVSLYDHVSKTWSASSRISYGYGAGSDYVDASIDTSGNIFVVWDYNSNIYYNKYINGTGWLTTDFSSNNDLLLETDSGAAASYPRVSINDNDDVVGVWKYQGYVFPATTGTAPGLYLSRFINNTSPILTSLSATPNTDSTGDIKMVSTVNDGEANDLSLEYHYAQGSCGSYSSQPKTSILSAVDGSGSLTVTNNVVTGVSTASANNVVTTTWDISANSAVPNTQYCIYAFANDGTVDSSVATTTVYTNPNKPLTVSASANGQTSINLSWNANSNPTSTVYKIYNVSKSLIMGSTTSTSYTITGLSAESNYVFKVRAVYNSDNVSYVESDASNAVTTDAPARQVTMTLKAENLSDDVATPTFTFVGVNETHTAKVEAIVTSTDPLVRPKARIVLHSNPVTVTLSAGESENVDISGNGVNDTTVTVNTIDENTGEVNFTLTNMPRGGSLMTSNPPKVTSTSGRAVFINNDEKTTVNRTVKLKLDITNASQMAISNSADFNGASFENYTTSKDWTLTEGSGTKIVFVKFRANDGSTIVYSDSIELVGQSFSDPNSITNQEMLNNTTSCSLTPGKAYKISKSPVVYYITKDCTKQIIPNEKYYFSYFSNWKEVETISSDELNNLKLDKNKNTAWGAKYDPKYGALVKTLNDPKVYLLLNDNKYWITNEEVFKTLRYNWKWVEEVSQELLDKYTTKEEITDTAHHPNYTLVKYANDPKVYRLEADPTDNTKQVKRHIPNEKEFYKLNFRFDRVVTIPDTETYTTGEQLES